MNRNRTQPPPQWMSPRQKRNQQTTKTLLHASIVKGSIQNLLTSIKRGVDINAADENGQTALHIAAYYGLYDKVRLLLFHGANKDIKDKHGLTALQWAQRQGRHDVILELADLNKTSLVLEQLKLRENINKIIKISSNPIQELANQLNTWTKELNYCNPGDKVYLQSINTISQWLQKTPREFQTQKKSQRKITLTKKQRKESGKTKKRGSKHNEESEQQALLIKYQLELKQITDHFNKNPTVLPDNIETTLQKCLEHLETLNDKINCFDVNKLLDTPLLTITQQLDDNVYLIDKNNSLVTLNPSAARWLIPYFSEEEERHVEQEFICSHPVFRFNDILFKLDPSAPRYEDLMFHLTNIITRQGIAPTELFALKYKDKYMLSLIPLYVHGKPFVNLIQNNPYLHHEIDSYDFSLHYMLSLLARYQDGKFENFICQVVEYPDGRVKYHIIGIDNDEINANAITFTSPEKYKYPLHLVHKLPPLKDRKKRSIYVHRGVRNKNLYYATITNELGKSTTLIINKLPGFEKFDISKLPWHKNSDHLNAQKNNETAQEFSAWLAANCLLVRRHYVALKSCFFSMNGKEDELDPIFVKDLLEQDAELIVLKLLIALYHDEKKYAERLAEVPADVLKKSGIPMLLVPDMPIRLYQDIRASQEYIRTHPNATHEDLLEHLYKFIKRYYDTTLGNKNNDPFEGFNEIFTGPPLERITKKGSDQSIYTKEEHAEIAAKYKKRDDDYIEQRTKPVKEALDDFFQYLINKDLPDDIRQQVIATYNDIGVHSEKSVLKNMEFNQKSKLTGQQLTDFARKHHGMQSITINNCPKVTLTGLLNVLLAQPQITIKLKNFDHISADDLLNLADHCKNLILTVDGKEYAIGVDDASLLQRAIIIENEKLVDFLLVRGTHQNNTNFLPLHEALRQQQFPAASKLIDHDVPLDQVDARGNTALDIIAELYEKSQNPAFVDLTTQLLLKNAFNCKTSNAKKILDIIHHGLKLHRYNEDARLAALRFLFSYNLITPKLIARLLPYTTQRLSLGPVTHDKDHKLDNIRLLAVISNAPHLKQLDISGCKNVDNNFIHFIKQSSVEKLYIDFQQAIAMGLFSLPNPIPRKNGNDLHIIINSITLNNAGFKQNEKNVIKVLNSTQHLIHTLKISGALTPAQLDNIASGLAIQTNIHTLNLSNTKISNPELKTIVSALKDNTALHTLRLDENNIGTDANTPNIFIDQPATTKANTYHLQKVVINKNEYQWALTYQEKIRTKSVTIPLEQVIGLNAALLKNDIVAIEERINAYHLSLGGRYLADLLSNKNIKVLILFKNSLGDGGLKFLLEGMRQHPVTTKLDINGNNITLYGAKLLAQTLLKNSNINILDAGYNEFPAKTDELFHDVMRLNSTITTFKCRYKGISPEIENKITKKAAENEQQQRQQQLRRGHQQQLLHPKHMVRQYLGDNFSPMSTSCAAFFYHHLDGETQKALAQANHAWHDVAVRNTN